MKTEVTVKINGNERVRSFRNVADKDTIINSLTQELIKNSYVSNGKLIILSDEDRKSVSGKDVKQILLSNVKVKDNIVFVPTSDLLDIAKSVCANSGQSTHDAIKDLLEDSETLIEQKFAFQLPVIIEEKQVKEKVFEIAFVEAIIDGKHYKGSGESYIIERDE